MAPNVVLSLSGGMDSATLLGKAVSEFGKDGVCCVFFIYDARHNVRENLAVTALLAHYKPAGAYFIDARPCFPVQQSALMTGANKPIPEGHYTDESMKATVVPGRNLIFASILAGIAGNFPGTPAVWLGVHAGDHAIYPDCRPAFVNSLNYTVNQSSEGKVAVNAPFLRFNKTEILRAGMALKVPYEHTRTCYTHQELACGKCGSCVERLEAFKNLGLTDPVPYQK